MSFAATGSMWRPMWSALRSSGMSRCDSFGNVGDRCGCCDFGSRPAGAEDAYENMICKPAVQSQTSSSMALAYGENQALQFPPRITVRSRATETTGENVSAGQNSFCVRTCDGRYFPISSQEKQSAA